jgi:protein-disulfide isomerase
VEYGDYESLECGEAHRAVKDVQSRLGDRLRFVFRHCPRDQVHPHAQYAAEAAEEAAAQGRFWAMHDLLFEHQGGLDDPQLHRYARFLGLDMAAFEQALATHRHAGRVREDVQSGMDSGVTDTPAFFLNGVRYDGPHEGDALIHAIVRAEMQHVVDTSL